VIAPAVVAGAAGFAVATGAQWLAWNDAPITELLLGGAFGGTAALGVLGLLDERARDQAKRLLGRVRRRPVVTPAAEGAPSQ